jgi:phosphatidylserine/phosphatidylglycerophosphate/cardiolipin synthase-like enzyme
MSLRRIKASAALRIVCASLPLFPLSSARGSSQRATRACSSRSSTPSRTVVVDQKNNVSEDRSGKARAALSSLVNAGVDVRTISVYPIHHDKVIVADRETVELGSFNYSDAAARRNSENVLVNWRNPKLAEVYLAHFERNHRQASPYHLQY